MTNRQPRGLTPRQERVAEWLRDHPGRWSSSDVAAGVGITRRHALHDLEVLYTSPGAPPIGRGFIGGSSAVVWTWAGRPAGMA